MDANSLTLTPREAARLIGVDYGTIRRYIKSGQLRCHMLTRRRWVIVRGDLERFVMSAPLVHEADEK